MSNASVSTERANQLKECTEQDETTQRLMKVIANGWQRNKTNVHGDIQVYFDVRDELTVENGIVMEGQQVIVPKPLQEEYITRVHMGHLGVDATLRKAQQTMYFPDINKMIRDKIGSCSICNCMKKHQRKE